ncbi:MAG TPA: rRNA maturation RNase YbeY [Cyanobacteria bacterium UBA8530]|nr:rRNA maturation RNase YbeY [Cyanobacteria bacterium UBA8530]
METYLENRQNKENIDEDFWSTRLSKLADMLGIDPASEVSVLFVDDEEIQELNRQYRSIDSATDVLSFPQEEGEAFPTSPEMPHPLGDIVVSIETAIRQAKEIGNSLEREITFLLIHGLLHLLGYDHEGSEDEEMYRRQREILEDLYLSDQR